jgi:dipeptidyl aminopeptidase/acylaminoacyl peptidase
MELAMLFVERMFKRLFFLLFFVSGAVLASPTPNDYGALPTTDMVAISPSGESIAYRKANDSQNAIVVTSITQKKILFAIEIAKLQPQKIYFLNENQIILIASEFRRVEGFLGKFDVSTAFVLNIDDKKIRQLLTPGDKILAGQSGLGSIVGTTADGKYALMPAWSDINNIFPDSYYSLYKVNLTRNLLTVAKEGTQTTADYFVDQQGDALVMEDYNDRTNAHKIKAKQGGKWIEIFSESAPIRNKNFVGLTADFKYLVFLERDEKTDHDSYNLMALADGSITKSIFAKENAEIESVIVDTQRVVHGVRYSGFVPSYKFFDSALDERVKGIVAQFPEQSVHLERWSPDWKHIVVNVQGSSYVDDYFLFSDNKQKVFLTTGRPQIKAEDINPLGKLTYTARDGLKIPTLITIPRTKSSEIKNLPVVIYPHGGPEYHDTIGFDYFAQALASEGYLVIQPQFRGSSGFGLKHKDAGLGEWGKKMQDDITDAVKFFSAKGIIDPKRVCILGASYGGYAALAGGAFTPDLYKCVVSINGVSDVNNMLSYDKNHNGKNSEAFSYWKLQLANGEVDKNSMEQISPVKFAQQFMAHVLLINSSNDKIVEPEQSTDMLKALEKQKKSAKLITLEGDDHHLEKGLTRTKAVTEVVAFVKENLK